jgi:alpha-L-rhamnosidase
MKRWVLYLEELLDPDYVYRNGTYGDWVDAYTMDKQHLDHGATSPDHGATSRELLWTAYMYYNLRTVEKTADFLGKPEDAAYFRALAEKVEIAFIDTFFDPDSCTFRSETQTSYVLPLAFGLVPLVYRQAVIDNLVNDIMVKHGGHLTVGCPGLKWLMQTLTATGNTDVAYTILTRTKRPSWGYMVAKDGTSIWERWDRDTRDPGMNGQSQTILAGYLGAWMYQTLGGIAYDISEPGFKNIFMRPEPVGDLRWVNASFESLYGQIVSNWKSKNGIFTWKVRVPPNCTASVYIPATDAGSVKESGRILQGNRDVKFIRMDANTAVCEIGSGEFDFSSEYPLN